MPIAMERKLTLMGIFGLANNEKYKYPNYFQISPNGPDPEISTPLGFFELAARQNPKPRRWPSSAPTPSTRRTRWSAPAS